jgi:hypothetical protein
MHFRIPASVIAVLLIAISPLLLAQDLKATWAPHVTDCSAFFGVWGQSDSSAAMSVAMATYSKQVHGAGEVDAELMQSRRRMASMLHQARKGEVESKEAVAKQTSLCLATLKKAEQDLWPKLSAIQKQETPKLTK